MNKIILILLIVLILILTTVISVGGYYIYKELYSSNNIEKIEETNNDYKELSNFEMNDIILNTKNSKGRLKLMKLSLTLKLNGEQDNISTLEEFRPELQNEIIILVSDFDSESLISLQGKNLFKDSLAENFNKLFQSYKLDINLEKILFTTFVIK